MQRISLPSIQHVAKSIQPTIEGTVETLLRFDKGIPPFSYHTAWRLAYLLYSGKITLAAALAACERINVEQGAISNAEVAKIIWDDAENAEYFCHPLTGRRYAIRHDLAIPVRPRFYFVRNGSIQIFWLQPWKTFELNEEQLGLLASVIKQTFVVDDFAKAELYMLDTSARGPTKTRCPKVYGFSELPLLGDEGLKAVFDRFAAAYDIFVKIRPPKPERPGKKRDPRQGQLF
jgi:hypothetical protein